MLTLRCISMYNASSVQRPALDLSYLINSRNRSVNLYYTTLKFFQTILFSFSAVYINEPARSEWKSASFGCVRAFLYKCKVHYAFKVIKFPCVFCCSSIGMSKAAIDRFSRGSVDFGRVSKAQGFFNSLWIRYVLSKKS